MYSDIELCDQIKTLKNLLEPDSRTESLSYKIEKYMSLMEEAKLTEAVPREIRIQFDIARNIFIFSYYSYRMGMAAQVQAFAVLEAALLRRLRDSKIEEKKQKPSLSELFQYAINHGWINDMALPPNSFDLTRYPEDIMFWCMSLKNYWAPSMEERKRSEYLGRRNELLHQPGSLDLPFASAEVLRKCAYLINAVFENSINESACGS